MYRVEYEANNSGGDWWLDDEDWYALERAGWTVDWFKDDNRYRGDRFLGALAGKATLYGVTLPEAVASFERHTKACATDAGCPCCGPPHEFMEFDEQGKLINSGPDVEYTAHF